MDSLPALEVRPARPVRLAPAPLRATLAGCSDGGAGAEPDGGAVEGIPDAVGERGGGDLGDAAGVEVEGARIGLDRAGVGDGAGDVEVGRAGTGGLADRALVDDRGLPAEGIVDAAVAFDEVGSAGLDLERGRETLSLCSPRLPVPLWMIVPKLSSVASW